MKKIIYTFPFLLLGILLLTAYSSGAPAGYTASPGDNGNNCTACHSGGAAVNPTITLTGIPSAGYTPGQTYTLTLDVSGVGNPRTGFEACIEDASHQKTGTFSNSDSNTQALSGGQYITHTSQGNALHQWTFQWQAPSTDQGDLYFYAAINLTNGDNNTTGDYPTRFSMAVPSAGTAVHKLTDEEFLIYPNPAGDYLMYETPRQVKELYAVDMTGKRYALTFSGHKVDVRGLASGNYVLFVKTDKGSGTKRFIKK